MSGDAPTAADFEPLTAEVELNPPEQFARALLEHTVDRGATDLFITDDTDATVITVRQLGELVEVRRLTRAYGRRLQNHLRALANADVADHQHPASGRSLFQIDERRVVDLRINAIPSLFGQDVAVRLFVHGRVSSRLDQLGMLDDELGEVRRLLDAPSGLILISGPTGSGKSHSLYACLDHLNNGRRKIHTIEEPIEFIMPGIVQSQVSRKAGLDYPQLLHAALRQSPDVIMVGEIRDEASAQIAVRAAASGQLVLATIHAEDTIGAVHSMLSYGASPQFLAATLVGVIAQRLVRRLCKDCRQAMALPEQTRWMHALRERFHDERAAQIYVPQGCDQCKQRGFDRMICIPEVLTATPHIRQAIIDQRSHATLREFAVEAGMRTLREACQMRIALGAICGEDIYDVLPPMLATQMRYDTRLPSLFPGEKAGSAGADTPRPPTIEATPEQ